VTRIDPTGRRRPQTITVGGSPQSLVVARGQVWVTVDQTTVGSISTAGTGGTVRLSDQRGIDSIDPALAFTPDSWQLLYPVCAKLVNYPDRPAPAGSQLKPEVAATLPTRSADGKTYTFTVRTGFRFSPPSDAPVTAQTFKYAIERSLSPVMKSPAQGFMRDVVGAQAYMAGEAAHISGVVARGNRLVIHLLAPAPDIVTRLGLPFFCAVPLGTPLDPNGLRAIPSAGPYYVASYVPKQGLVLKRNPNYRGSRPHRFDQIVLSEGVSPQRIDRQIEAGQVDYGLDSINPADIGTITARYGPESPAARKGRQQFFIDPEMGVDFLWLNLHRPSFSSRRLRRAVNYAIDRRTLARIGNAFTGVPEQPTDQYLPPGMPGFKDARIYPFSPDLATAKRLAGPIRRDAVLYTCDTTTCAQLAQVVTTNLAAIGIHLHVRAFPITTLFARLQRKNEPYDLAFAGGWAADYVDPDDFLNFLIGSGAAGSIPGQAFTDPSYQQKIQAAALLSGPARYLTYGNLDAQTARTDAPTVALGNFISQDFFSARIGCQTYQPVYGIDLATLCTRK
jgi:peptide/nickel transport system substrate-binding protein